jgi:hypothetical protein
MLNPEEDLLTYSLQIDSPTLRSRSACRPEGLRGWGETPVLSSYMSQQSQQSPQKAEGKKAHWTQKSQRKAPLTSHISTSSNHRDSLKQRLKDLNDEETEPSAFSTLSTESAEHFHYIQWPTSYLSLEAAKEGIVKVQKTSGTPAKKGRSRILMPMAQTILLEPKRPETIQRKASTKLSEASKFRLRSSPNVGIFSYQVESDCFLSPLERKMRTQVNFYLKAKSASLKL